MKVVLLFSLLLTASLVYAQTLPIDFETTVTTEDFTDFDGGTAAVLANPEAGGINTSAMVARIVREGGQPWAGSKITLDANLDFSTSSALTMKVFTTAPVGTTLKFKLEGASGSAERDVQTTVSSAWEELTWDFTGTPPQFNTLVFMFDFDNVGDGSANSTFLFDDIEQRFVGAQIDLPVDFEGSAVNYAMTDFGGNVSSLVTDPTDASNQVIQVIKTSEAETWAGTTIGTPAGFASNIPLTLTESKMTVKVWSPEAGTPIRLKVEDANDPTHTCETQTNTTVAGDWEVLEFDFANEATGTAELSFGLTNGWTYNMASIFFNFDTDGATAGATTYYFDEVRFGDFASDIEDLAVNDLSIYPNPTGDHWTIQAQELDITRIVLFDGQGRSIRILNSPGRLATIPAAQLPTGTYFAKISTREGTSTVRLVKQ